jgi:hypothetical protein
MDDKKIKEEFERFITNPWTDEMGAFEKSLTKKGLSYREAYGFYAGFRAAERLAKIEVLEKIKLTAWSAVDTDEVLEEVRLMISELKAGN